MTIFDYINGFWQESDKEPFNTTEISLYYFLLYEANRRHWVMPFALHTSIICFHINAHKANIKRARDKLKRRNMIDFEKGESKVAPAKYRLLEINTCLATNAATNMTTDAATYSATHSATISATDPAAHNKIKDKEEKEEGDYISHPRENQLVGVRELREMFFNDTEWQNSIIELLFKKGFLRLSISMLQQLLDEFFDMLTISKVSAKTDTDCRNYFYNWVRLELTKKQKNNEYNRTNKKDQRGRSEAPVASPKDYEGDF